MDWVKVVAIGVLVAEMGVGVGVRGAGPADPLEMMKQREQKQKEEQAAATRAAQQPADLLRGDAPALRRIEELAPALRAEQVREGVRKGSDFLFDKLQGILSPTAPPSVDQQAWSRFAGDQSVGVVALMVHALIEAGRMTDDARFHPLSKELAPAIDYLVKARTWGTYSASLQAGVLAMLPPRPEYRAALKRVRNDLMNALRGDGGYGYGLGRQGDWDNSNTQFAVLGMWQAADAGAEVPMRFWQIQDAHWRRAQGSDGAWGYREMVRDFKVDPSVTLLRPLPSITAAGLASLYVTTDQLSLKRPAGGDKALEAGLARVEADLVENFASQNLYYLYALERVGAATGRKTLGHMDWYRMGAAGLLLSQREDGAWMYAGELPGTALAILFLTHGGAPVIFNVMEHGQLADWDPQPRAVAKLTRWMSRTLERPLNWQVVSATSDWGEAPILVISGSKDPAFTEEQLGKIRAYIQGGGMVFSVGDGPDGPFSAAMAKYATLATGGKYDLRTLPADHSFFTTPTKIEHPIQMWGISNGVRELWVHSTVDLGYTWQMQGTATADHWQIPLNIVRYATGQERPRARLDSLAIAAPASKPEAAAVMARLRYSGNWDPEPGAWPRLGAMLALEAGTALELPTVDVGELKATTASLAHLTGTAGFTLDEAQKAALGEFLKDGGTLVGDAAGGSEEFAKSFKSLAESLSGMHVPEMLRADDPLFADSAPGMVKVGAVEFRKGTPADRELVRDHPEIVVWKIGGRPAILFSQLDVTSGLLGTETWGIAGYRPGVAQRIARNLVLGRGMKVAH
jgi:hypothetical protein